MKQDGKHGKRLRNIKKSLDLYKKYSMNEAVELLMENSNVKFDASIEVALNLGVDPKHSDQMVRGVMVLPNGTGKKVRVAAFAKDKKAEEAKEAGADIVGADDLISDIMAGNINFDICVATPDMMVAIGKVAKILGPKGLMPNPKLGTVAADIANAIKNVKAGQVEFRTEKNGIIHAGVGKVSFGQDKIIENVKAFIEAINKAKPSGAKGTYMKSVYLSSTMGPSLLINLDL